MGATLEPYFTWAGMPNVVSFYAVAIVPANRSGAENATFFLSLPPQNSKGVVKLTQDYGAEEKRCFYRLSSLVRCFSIAREKHFFKWLFVVVQRCLWWRNP